MLKLMEPSKTKKKLDAFCNHKHIRWVQIAWVCSLDDFMIKNKNPTQSLQITTTRISETQKHWLSYYYDCLL